MAMTSLSDTLLKIRYKWSFQKIIGELLLKKWMEPIIPFIVVVILILVFGSLIENYFDLGGLGNMAGEIVEFGFLAIAMAITIMAGGIDLSVASMFALSDMLALIMFKIYQLPAVLVIAATIILGGLMGAVNGVFVGYMKARAFLSTLVTMLVYRSAVGLLERYFGSQLGQVAGTHTSAVWTFLGEGSIIGIPFNVFFLLIILIAGSIFLTRSRPGWRMLSIGSNRRAARHAGINVERTIFYTYVLSGVLCAIGGLFYGMRLNSCTRSTAAGMELMALTAAIIGGVSLSGGKGTPFRIMLGTLIVWLLGNGLIRLGYTADVTRVFIGFVLLLGVGIDVKWAKNLFKTIQKIYVSPTYSPLPPCPDAEVGSGTIWEVNCRLSNAEPIGLGKIDGPEDVIVDRQGNIYGGTRTGEIVRIAPDDFNKVEKFARIGGRPLGMAFDRDDNLICCVGGMGVYGVRPNGEVYKVTTETNRTWTRIQDDSRLRLPDDLDIAPDGKIYFSEATIRFEMENFILDHVEGRKNGRMICHDPATGKTRTIIPDLSFPNGVCVAHDGQSIFFAQSVESRIMRYWIAGPQEGKLEVFIPNLPFYPDNINRGSKGYYWLASSGVRTPIFDMAMEMPEFRTRMVKRIPPDEWLWPNINLGGVVKFTDQGEIVEAYWDHSGKHEPMVTSMREHKGYLYLGGLFNNRIGRIKLEDADPDWSGPESYWGKK